MTRKRGAAVDIRSEDLKRLRRDLKQLPDEAKDELNSEIHSLADDIAGEARSNALGLGGVAAKSAPSVKATSARRSALTAGIGLGGNSAPWAGGAEFGGQRRPTTQQFKPWRGSGETTGYFLYPAIRANSDDIESRLIGALEDAFRKENFT